MRDWVWGPQATVLALSLIPLYVLGSTKLDRLFESVFYVDTGGLEVPGHDFGTFVDSTLVFGILFDIWSIFGQIGPKF